MSKGDAIHLEELELSVRIGVPEEERAQAQRLTLSLTLWPQAGFGALEDRIEAAVDYAEVVQEVVRFANSRRDKLIETLAERGGVAFAGELSRSRACGWSCGNLSCRT